MNKLAIIISTISFCIYLKSDSLAQKNSFESQNFNHSQTSVNIAINHSSKTSHNLNSQIAYGMLSETKWKAIATRYYQSRLRTSFESHNHLLSLWDVKELMGFPGIKVRESKDGNRQYWIWIDRHNPHRRIKATFNYYQLIDLKGNEFDSVAEDFIRAEVSREKR